MFSDGHAQRDAGLVRGLPGRHLSGPGGEHLAHDHVLNLLGSDAGLSSAALIAMPPRSVAGEVLQRTEQPSHRRTCAADDDRCRCRHDRPPMRPYR